jgi:hypothetical protein
MAVLDGNRLLGHGSPVFGKSRDDEMQDGEIAARRYNMIRGFRCWVYQHESDQNSVPRIALLYRWTGILEGYSNSRYARSISLSGYIQAVAFRSKAIS